MEPSMVTERMDEEEAREQRADLGASSAPVVRDVEHMVELYGERVLRFCQQLMGWHEDAFDLMQDVFVVAIERADTFRGQSSRETWLLGIAVQLCRNWGRRQAVRRRVMRWLPWTREQTSKDGTEHSDDVEELHLGLQQLNTAAREVLVLRYLEGHEIDAVARILGVTRGAVEQRLSRARRQLAAWLEQRQ